MPNSDFLKFMFLSSGVRIIRLIISSNTQRKRCKMKKRLPALLAAFLITAFITLAMGAVSLNALFNPNSVAASNKAGVAAASSAPSSLQQAQIQQLQSAHPGIPTARATVPDPAPERPTADSTGWSGGPTVQAVRSCPAGPRCDPDPAGRQCSNHRWALRRLIRKGLK